MKWDDGPAGNRFYYRGREHQQAQFTAAIRGMGDYAGKMILDVGCGYGDLLDHLPGEYRYVGIDPNGEALAEARRLHPDRTFHRSEKVPRADVVVAVASLQCADNLEEFAKVLWKAARERLVIVTCKPGHMPIGKQGEWWLKLPKKATVTESDDDFLTVVCVR